MAKASVSRVVQASSAQVMSLLLDFEKYPQFVPGVLRMRTKRGEAAAQKEAVEVEALLKNSKFSGTIRVMVQSDRPAGRVSVSHRFGPFKTLSIGFQVSSSAPRTTTIRCDLDVAATVPGINAIVVEYLKAAANAYAEVFVGELDRLASADASPG